MENKQITMAQQTGCIASQDELKQSDLNHYDKLSTECHHWSSGVPKAIEFYYEYQKMTLFQKIKLAFITKTKV